METYARSATELANDLFLLNINILKETVTKLKVRIAELSKEKERLVKLINIARPANMPELKASDLSLIHI